MPRIAVIPGDGIGLEVVREAVRVLEAVEARDALGLEMTHFDLGADRYLRDGITITDDEFDRLANDHDAILLGALGDPRVPGNQHARDILLGLRFRLDLYVNFRPAVSIDPELVPLRGGPAIDLAIFRENTEGPYVDMGGSFRRGTEHEVAIQEDVATARGVERIVRAAFDHAVRYGRERVTMVDKANAMPAVGGLWRRVFGEVAEDAAYEGLRTDTMYVDAMAMDLVRRPEMYDVVVTSNLFGDILSDLAAVLVGGLGMAASANLHPGRHALFEPVHGSAPDIAGSDRANPLGAIACTALMLDHLGHGDVARDVEAAVRAAVLSGPRTPDLGGSDGTEAVGRWVADHFSTGRNPT